MSEPGYIELAYHNAFCIELLARRIPFECEKLVTVSYRNKPVVVHRLDLVVRGKILIELEAVKALEPVHQAQLMSYLKASRLRVGLLMNFAGATFKEGVRRVVM